jgi:hypothetical protein
MSSAEVTLAFPKEKKHTAVFGIAAVVTVAIIIAVGYWSARSGLLLTWSWGIMAALLIVFLAALGLQVHGRLWGALIDEMNLMSLSRFQLVAWTLLIVSAFLVMALMRAFSGVPDALKIEVPPELWQLLGITAAGAVGKEVVHAVKKNKDPQNPDVAAMRAAAAINKQAGAETNPQEVEVHRAGMLFGNPTPQDASIVDMFQGVEVGNTAYVDISKVQMFFFTIAALVAYGSEIFTILSKATPDLSKLPPVGSGLVAILTISHATYLGAKSVDHTNGTASNSAQAKASAVMAQPFDDPLERDA